MFLLANIPSSGLRQYCIENNLSQLSSWLVECSYRQMSALAILPFRRSTHSKSTKKKVCSKFHLHAERAKFFFNMSFQFQNKAERLNCLEK